MIRTSARGIRMQKYCGCKDKAGSSAEMRVSCRRLFRSINLTQIPGNSLLPQEVVKEFYREMILNNFYVMCMAWFNNISNYIFYTKC